MCVFLFLVLQSYFSSSIEHDFSFKKKKKKTELNEKEINNNDYKSFAIKLFSMRLNTHDFLFFLFSVCISQCLRLCSRVSCREWRKKKFILIEIWLTCPDIVVNVTNVNVWSVNKLGKTKSYCWTESENVSWAKNHLENFRFFSLFFRSVCLIECLFSVYVTSHLRNISYPTEVEIDDEKKYVMIKQRLSTNAFQSKSALFVQPVS